MDAVCSELAKLDALSGQEQGKWPSIISSLDALLDDLRRAKESIQPSTLVANQVLHVTEERKKAVDERQKEVYNCLNRLARGLDKV